MSEERVGERSGRRLGMVVFVIGVISLLVVFALAVGAFSGVAQGLKRGPVTLDAAGGLVALAVARAFLLMAMAYAGSLLASKGIELLAVSSGRPRS
jgi:TRAP-type C4-dicarboxylate transport system permease small subunit